jgi:hypothetical protein
LSSIEDQDYPNITVYISDHSQDYEVAEHIVENWLDEEGKRPFKLNYIRYEENRGSAVANMNHVIDEAPKDSLIKMLFQDDLLRTPDAISLMVTRLEQTGAHWLGVGCNHVDENGKDLRYLHPPRWTSSLHMAHGHNLIGSPSVVMFRNCELRMDPKLCYLNDCEFYYRMGQQYGPPALLNDIVVTIRMRKDGLSSTLDVDEVKARESRYLQKKFKEV